MRATSSWRLPDKPTDRPTDQPRLRSTHRRVSYGNLICSYKTIYTCTMPEMYSMNELIVRSTSRILQDDATCWSTQKQCRRTCFRFTHESSGSRGTFASCGWLKSNTISWIQSLLISLGLVHDFRKTALTLVEESNTLEIDCYVQDREVYSHDLTMIAVFVIHT